jgi:hypothetical protein
MLIKLHAKCAVNPINVAAVICGKISVGVMLTNGRTHNIECRGNGNCSVLFKAIITALEPHIYLTEVGAKEPTMINPEWVLSIAEITPGIAVNMAGDFVITVPCGMSSKPEYFNKIIRQLEPFK